MAIWHTEIYDRDGALIGDISTKALNRRIGKLRNRADTISLRYDLDDIKRYCQALGITVWQLFGVSQNEVRVKRGTTVISAGHIVEAHPSIMGDRRTIEIIAVGWFDLLGLRITDEGGPDSDYYFEATDAGQIAWGLINASQQQSAAADFGITQGTIQASVDRDRTDYSFKNIRDAIIQLSEVIDGFDFEVTWDKVFNVYYPKIGSRRTDIELTYPGNIRELSFGRYGMQIANQITARGAGFGPGAYKSVADDLTSQGKFWLRQRIVDFNDVSTTATLDEHAAEELRVAKEFTDIPTLVLDQANAPKVGTYGIGDEIKIGIDADFDVFGPVSDWFRIDGMDIALDENEVETVTLEMMH